MTEFIARRLRSGQTMRYHTVPRIGPQSVAEHSWRACVLMHTLWPQYVTMNAILWMLYHDSPEQELGDLPAPAKWKHPTMYEYYGYAETSTEHELEIAPLRAALTPDEISMCSMADMLECVDHVGHRIIRGDHSFEAREIYWNGRKHLFERHGKNVLFMEVQRFMLHLHEQVAKACPAAATHVS